jgi:hypothetical protein
VPYRLGRLVCLRFFVRRLSHLRSLRVSPVAPFVPATIEK